MKACTLGVVDIPINCNEILEWNKQAVCSPIQVVFKSQSWHSRTGPIVQGSYLKHSHGERERARSIAATKCAGGKCPLAATKQAAPSSSSRTMATSSTAETSSSIRTLVGGKLLCQRQPWSVETFHGARWRGTERFFPNPIALGFDSSYGSLVGWRRNLQYVPLGKIAVEQAVWALYCSNTGSRATRKAIKRSTTALLIMFFEGHRFSPITNFVDPHWNSNKPVLLCTRKLFRDSGCA